MKLFVDKTEAVQLLKDRIADLDKYEFIPKVWKDRTILDVKQIFGQTSDQWLQVSGIHFETFIVSEKQHALQEGKNTARQLLNSYMKYIEEYSAIEGKRKAIEEDNYKNKYRQLLSEWNEFVPQYNELMKEHEQIQNYNESLEVKIQELESQITEKELREDVLPFELVQKTRGYIRPAGK